jgi:tRNA (mo5U34)-methyltransferase
MGVLYHLRYPLLALDLIRAHVAEKLLVCQSLQRGERRIASLAPDYPFDETSIFHDLSVAHDMSGLGSTRSVR